MISILEVIHKKHKDHKWDTVWAVVGDEGTGKSSFNAWILHYWQLMNNGKVTADDAKHMCLDREMWLTDLKDAIKCDCSVNDETDLYSRRSMDSFNVAINKVYQIIRADSLFTVLTMPSLWDLDTFFRNRRLRGLVYITKRGKYAFWSKTRLRKMVEINSRLPYKNYRVVKPTHIGWFSKYNGPFEDAYRSNKDSKMQELRNNLYESVFGEGEKKKAVSSLKKRNEVITKLVDKGIPITKVAELLDMSPRQIHNIRDSEKEE